MYNVCKMNKNEIFITSPGKATHNKISNDLIWEVNSFLHSQFELYMVYKEKVNNVKTRFFMSGETQKHAVFQRLDPQFIIKRALEKSDIDYYRSIMDPKGYMDDDVFEELCYMENVDMEYVATTDLEELSFDNLTFETTASFYARISSSFPVYISLFGAREMKIIINQPDLQQEINKIVLKYCEESN